MLGGQNPISPEYQIYHPTIDTLVTGMIWRTIMQKERLDVRLNFKIEKIERLDWRYFNVHLRQQSNIQCNFVIWTPAMSSLLDVLEKPSSKEIHLFLTIEVYTAHLVNFRGVTGNAIYIGLNSRQYGAGHRTTSCLRQQKYNLMWII